MTWTEKLAEDIKNAEPGAVVQVDSEAKKELGERAAKRLGRTDLVFVVAERA